MEEFKPGQVITPQTSSPSQPPAPSTGAPEPMRPPIEMPQPSVPAPSQEPQTPLAATRAPVAADSPVSRPNMSVPQANWEYNGHVDLPPDNFDDQYALLDVDTDPDDEPLSPMSWTAAEFIAHDKSSGWYVRLAVFSLVATAIIYFLTRDNITTGIVLFASVSMGVFAARKPHDQSYGLNFNGVQVGRKIYGYEDFKSFSVAEDGTIISVVFMPLKRFMPTLTIYVTPEIEGQVLQTLSAILPFEQHKQDAVDSLMKKIRF